MPTTAFDLAHPAGVQVNARLTEGSLRSAVPSVETSRRDMGTGWVWYRLPVLSDGEVQVSIALGFEREVLKHIILSDSSPKFGAGWNDWTEEKEKSRAESIRRWLEVRGFAPGTYSWGSVWAGFDPKGGAGTAAVRFA